MAAQAGDPELAEMYIELAREYEAIAERAETMGGHGAGAGNWSPHGRH